MTLFEYIAVATSIILSLSVVRLLDALPYAFAAERRSWVHAGFVIVVLWAAAHYWWVSWSFAGVESWTYPKFLLFLAVPALLYSLAKTLAAPDPSVISSFSDHFQRVHRRFFLLFAAYMLALQLGSWVILDVPVFHPLRGIQLLVFLALASAAYLEKPRYHGAVLVFLLAVLLLTTVRLIAPPGPLSPPR